MRFPFLALCGLVLAGGASAQTPVIVDPGVPPAVVLYEYRNFQGGRLALYPGDEIGQTCQLRFDNGHEAAGRILSIQLAGAPVSLFPGPAFMGQSLLIESSIPDLEHVMIEGRVQSLRFGFQSLRVGDAPQVVVVPPGGGDDDEQREAQFDSFLRGCFRDIWRHDPRDDELLPYRRLMYREHWTERMIADDMRRRREELRDHGANRIIEKAFRDVLGRAPDAQAYDHYRNEIIDKGMTDRMLVADLRRSGEFRGPVVNAMISRAYRDLLGRDPDASGLDHYRNKIIDKGMTEFEMRNDLMRSDEYKNRRNGSGQPRK